MELIGYTLIEGYGQNHKKWKLGSSSCMNGRWMWWCTLCQNTRSIRHSTLFSNSKLEIGHILDLIYLWSQELDFDSFLRRHCKFASELTIVGWKNFVRGLCGKYFLRYLAVIRVVGNVAEIDESGWTEREWSGNQKFKAFFVLGFFSVKVHSLRSSK